MTERAGNPWQV